MQTDDRTHVDVPESLLEAIRSFPVQRVFEHCGVQTSVSPFDIYANCPQCGERVKVRSYSAAGEIEDVFDAVFDWMNSPDAAQLARQRQAVLADEDE